MKKRKVLEIVNSLGIGGNPIFVMNYFRVLDKEKFQIDFLIFDDSRLDFKQEVCDAGSNIYACPQENRNSLLNQMKYVYSFLKENHYDVVHCHNCAFKGLLRGTIPAKLAGIDTVIAHSHNTGRPKYTTLDNLTRVILKGIMEWSIDYGLACSNQAGQSKYSDKFMKSDKYRVIYNAVDGEKYRYQPLQREAIREKYNIDKEFVIGSIGRLEEQKNYLFFIDVFYKFLKTNPEAYFLLVGDGSQKESILKRIKELGIEERVIMPGSVLNPEVYYQAMDLFVLPSIYEGFGLVNIEAQISGLPCLVSSVVPKEVNISGAVWFLNLENAKNEWIETIEKIRKESNLKVRETVDGKAYDIRNAGKLLQEIYEK